MDLTPILDAKRSIKLGDKPSVYGLGNVAIITA